ncbi:MAG: DUF998 domain-containing protein [Reichenbachiella sp.]|uniref:DUF998 domain-containing protein n=1 Tax=Reichenbachiella sp. TaxID=2184521 RepID=UPI0032663E5A
MPKPKKYLDHTHSYLALRKTVGWIGICLPFVLLAGTHLFDCESWPSISHYYYSTMGRVFIGALCAVALFMFFYTGFDWRDDWAGNFAGIFALGVAWFPTTLEGDITTIGWIHYGCAASLFVTFAIFSLVLFTKTKDDNDANRTAEKRIRDRIYKACGWVIIFCIVSIPIYSKLWSDSAFEYTFWAETLALVSFGFSWLTKGGYVMADKTN